MGRRGCPALPGTPQRRWIPGTPGTAGFTLPTPLASGNYYWVVRAQNGVGVGPFSAGMVFSVGGPPAAPTLIGPQGGGIGTTPAFTFTTVTGATGYQLWLTDGTTWLSSTTWYTPAQVDPGNTGYCWLHLTDAPGFRQLLLGCPGTEWGWGSGPSVPGWCSAFHDLRAACSDPESPWAPVMAQASAALKKWRHPCPHQPLAAEALALPMARNCSIPSCSGNRLL